MKVIEREAVTALAEDFLTGLCEWLAIPSISADPAHHPDVSRSAHWLAGALRRDGWPQVEVWDSGPALPAVYACWPAADPAAPTVLVYGHHDVQPVEPLALWTRPPFEPAIVGEELFGRGASDDKGQVAMQLLGVKAHMVGRTAPAVTIKLFVEGEEESGSPNLVDLLDRHRDELACDLVVLTDTPLYSRDAPTVCTGQRGVYGAEVVFTGGSTAVHSGRVGGGVPNPATAIARLVAALHDEQGRVRLPDFYADVVEPTAVERADYAALPFDEADWLAVSANGARAVSGEVGWSTLERVWVRPTAEVNGIVGGYTGPGLQTIVPSSAAVKLSFRLVPDQRPERVAESLREFVAAHTPPGLVAEVIEAGGAPPYAVDVNHPANEAVREVLEASFEQPVRFSRTGGSGPAAVLHDRLGVPIVYLGATLPDDRIHAPNERVVVPLLLRGAEAAARLWRLLPERLS